MKDKVRVVSAVSSRVGVNVPDLRLSRTWARKGAEVVIEREVLEQAMYDPGVAYMFAQGILFVKDEEDEVIVVDSGIVPPVPATDKLFTKMLTEGTVAEFKQQLKGLSNAQIQEFVRFAVANELGDAARLRAIKDITETDIVKIRQLAEQDKESAPKED